MSPVFVFVVGWALGIICGLAMAHHKPILVGLVSALATVAVLAIGWAA